MKKLVATFVLAAALSIVPAAPSIASGCPDPENPCDPQPIDPIRELKDYYCEIKGC